MEPVVIQQMTQRIFDLLAEKMDAKGATLKRRLTYVNRRLPGRARRAGAALVEAEGMADNPRLAMQVDGEALSKSYDVITQYLNGIDVAAERSRKRFNLMAAIAAQVLLVLAVAFAFLAWRGVL